MTKEAILTEISEQNNRDSWSLDNGMDYFDGNASSVFKAMDRYTNQECIEFAVYIRANWQPYESPSNNIWWNKETGRYAYSEELYWYFAQLKKKAPSI